LVGLRVRVEHRQRLVGEDGDVVLQGALGARGAALGAFELPPLGDPLVLERGVGDEHDGAAADPARGLQPDQGLAGPGGKHHPGAPVPRRPAGLQRLQRPTLIGPQFTWPAGRFDSVHHGVRGTATQAVKPGRKRGLLSSAGGAADGGAGAAVRHAGTGRQTDWWNTWARTQACIATAAAAPALMDRVEPNWAMDSTETQTLRTSSDRPGPSWPNTRTQERGRG